MAATDTAGVVSGELERRSGATRTAPLPLVDDTGAANSAHGDLDVQQRLGDADHRCSRRRRDDARVSRHGEHDDHRRSRRRPRPSGTYDVYVYADGDEQHRPAIRPLRAQRAPAGRLDDSPIDAASTNFSGSFTQARTQRQLREVHDHRQRVHA